LNAVRDGWAPPEVITEDEYNKLKTAKPSPLRAFAGFGCSNSGKFFGGYARESTGRNFAANAANSLQSLRPMLQGVAFYLRHYLETDDLQADVIYCDPPYGGTTGFTIGRKGNKFLSKTFWKWAGERSKQSIVLVSEYAAPDGFVPVWQKTVKTDMNGKKGKIARIEKLFTHKTHKGLFQ
jgi:DNA adenine methylase